MNQDTARVTCDLPFCDLPIDGTSWIDEPPVNGVPIRVGFCCADHARLADRWLTGLPHTLVLGTRADDVADTEGGEV